ncbi:universal stress protein [Sphingomonas xanthus]|nr:universal stress protein [Sphingomonas xanthus]
MPDEIISTLDRPDRASAPSASAIGTILLHVQNDRSLGDRLESALSLARACTAHIHCVHVTPVEAFMAFDAFGGVFVMNDVVRALDEDETKLRERIERELANEDVTWDYEKVTGGVAPQLVRHGALADIIVTGRVDHGGTAIPLNSAAIGDILHQSRTPLFLPANGGGAVDPFGHALIAWDGSSEASNAVRASLGLLSLASSVQVIQISEEGKQGEFPSTRLLEYLSRHSIHAELRVETASTSRGDAVADLLLAHARETKAAYLVMGGYAHSRIGQYLFGGVTRSLLDHSELPLVIGR